MEKSKREIEEELLTIKIKQRIRFPFDKSILAFLRINDSPIVKRRGKLITNFALEEEKEKYIVESGINKSNMKLYYIKYGVRFFKTAKKIKLEFGRLFEIHKIDVSNAKSVKGIRKAIDLAIKEHTEWMEEERKNWDASIKELVDKHLDNKYGKD